ncbi:class I SAM-dependent methyltransferase [Streptomyces sp. NA04227]|nr:class I SAM-dependent methyltransferase [Streptomyces sp. NA04227]
MVPGYLDLVRGELERNVFARAVLAAFAELIRGGGEAGAPVTAEGGAAEGGAPAVAGGGASAVTDGGAPAVVEVGCGPGRITAHLASLGLAASGLDLSPAMVARARAAHPELRFEVGDMTTLDLPEYSLAGLVAWYSLIHVPPEDHPGVLARFHRALAPDGHLLLAFQAGRELVHYEEAFGHRVSLDFHRLDPDRLTAELEAAGFEIRLRQECAPLPTEPTPQGYLVARKVPERMGVMW